MTYSSFASFAKTIYSPTPLEDLFSLANESPSHCFFVKNQRSQYLYANQNFVDLMGLPDVKSLCQSTDFELSKSKDDAKKYRDHDLEVLEEESSIEVREELEPEHHTQLRKLVEGKLYPLYNFDDTVCAVLGIVSPTSKLLRLDWEQVFRLNPLELKALLIKRSYPITLPFGKTSLSRMEILTLCQLLKGLHAGEIANELGLQQTTVESYVVNIKNKLGANSRSELIHLIARDAILKQVIL